MQSIVWNLILFYHIPFFHGWIWVRFVLCVSICSHMLAFNKLMLIINMKWYYIIHELNKKHDKMYWKPANKAAKQKQEKQKCQSKTNSSELVKKNLPFNQPTKQTNKIINHWCPHWWPANEISLNGVKGDPLLNMSLAIIIYRFGS